MRDSTIKTLVEAVERMVVWQDSAADNRLWGEIAREAKDEGLNHLQMDTRLRSNLSAAAKGARLELGSPTGEERRAREERE